MIRDKENVNPNTQRGGINKQLLKAGLGLKMQTKGSRKGTTNLPTVPIGVPLKEAPVLDVQAVPDYADSIFKHLKETETVNMAQSGFMTIQTDINEKMRSILNDWLVDVHLKFKLVPETLFLTFNLIDRFLAVETVHRTKLQLVGVSAMLIASKYEDIYAPEVRDFAYITDNAYSRQEILKMEKKILTALDFEVLSCSSFRFLEHLKIKLGFSEEAFMYARFLLEMAQVDYNLAGLQPSLLAASCAYISLKRYRISSSAELYGLFEFTDSQVKDTAKTLLKKEDDMRKQSLQAVFKKFANPACLSVSKKQF